MTRFQPYLMIAFILGCSFAFAEPPGRAIGTRPAAKPAAGDGRRWAFMVGINNYVSQAKLKYCRQDCAALKQELIDRGRFDSGNVVLLTDDAARDQDRPTFGVIYARLPQMLDAAEPEDMVLVYLSGHGAQFEDAKGKYAAFIPIDGSGRQTSIPLSWVTEQLEACKARSKVLILDCCRNDVTEASRGGATLDAAAVRDTQGKTFVTIYSCDAGQKSAEHDSAPNGVFTHYLLEGLGGLADKDGDGRIDMVEAHQYARRQTVQWGVQHANPQSPLLKGEIGDPVTLAFVSRTTRPEPSRLAPTGPEPPRPASADLPKELTLDLGGGVTLECVLIPAGEFMMGSPESEEGHDSNEGPQHQVRISKDYYMGKYEVTQGHWESVMGSNPSFFSSSGRGKGNVVGTNTSNLPVEYVSWEDCQAFCRKLSQKIGKTVRLPSEAEWEYGCRAGTTTRYSFGDGDSSLGQYVWYFQNSDDKTHAVGSKSPNPWGLYDMHGNLYEWCEDAWHEDYSGAPKDGSSWSSGGNYNRRVLRGGSWYSRIGRWDLRSALRRGVTPVYRDNTLGFRVVVASGTP